MLTHAVEAYVASRHAAGFAFKEGSLLKSFAIFSEAKGQHHVRSDIAIEWAGLARSVPQCARRLGQVIRLARMLHVCFAGGLRVSELVSLRLGDLTLQPQASVLVHGKGRRERCLPLWKETTAALRAWVAVRGAAPVPELFLNARGQPMTRSGFEYILHKHVRTATQRCPSLSTKRVSPHVLRHTCALTVLQATKDLRKVSLWLGHAHMQTTEMYTRADPSVKLEALEAMIAPKLRSRRFKATDKLIAFLTSRSVMRSGNPSP